MKTKLKILILFFSINTSLLVVPEKSNAQKTVSFQVFYDDLSPYGNWIESPDYGYVWCPRVSAFTPYSTNGHWVLTDYGWTWVSDYSWGWAPFHYGRWYYDSFYGYVWVPGYEWGPGWVTWRRSNDYYGWAPIGPGVSISLAYSSGYSIPYNQWNFVRCNDFGRRDIHNYYIDRSKNVTIVNNTTVINNTRVDNSRKVTFNAGPDRMEVQRKVGKTINPVAVVDEKAPIQRVTKDRIQLYRPVVKDIATNNEGKKPVPAKVTPRSEMRTNANADTKRETPAVREVDDKKNEMNQPRKPIRDDDKQTPQVKQAPVPEAPVRDNPVRRNENNATPQVKQQPEQRPVRDDQPMQPQKEKVKLQGENPQSQRQVQEQPDKQRNVDRPVQQRPDRGRTTDQPGSQQRTEQPKQNVDQPKPQQRTEQPRQRVEHPQQRQMDRPMNQPATRPVPQQARPNSSGNKKGG